MYSYRVLFTKLVDLSETAYSHSVSEAILREKFKLQVMLIIVWDMLLYMLFQFWNLQIHLFLIVHEH